MTEKIKAPFGLWESPLTARMLSQQKKISDVQWGSRENTLYWLENRSGTGVLVSRKPAEGSQELSSDANVEAGIGYGGGEFHVWNDLIVFAGKDGRLYRRSTSSDLPRPIIPAIGMSAAPQISPNGKWIVYVFSDGKTDLLGMVDSAGKEWPFKLAQGADFYMQPVWHPNGEMLAWVEWDHPNMPWDGSRLMLANLGGSPPGILTTQHIAGDEKNYVCQPCFSPDGRWLAYIESSEEWDDLILYNLKTGFKHTLVKGSGYYQSTPAWVQGLRFMEWSHDSTSVFSIRNVGGFATLWKINIETGSEEQIQTPSYTWLSQISVSKVDQRLALIACGPTVPERVISWDGNEWTIECRSAQEDISAEYFPKPTQLSWAAQDGSTVFGIYYPPTNPKFTSEGKPPAILHIHGGPTSIASAGYLPEAAYFTSRGYAWLSVNYRGSSGYGNRYRNMLYQRWGEIDVEDTVYAAQALIDQGLADEKRLVITGGSAGGYTVLNALVHHPGKFKAGIVKYGVSNLFTLAMDTHKFEAKYTDWLVGELPEAAEKYHAWSPLFHAVHIRDALAIFHGAEDRVVPLNQSQEIVEKLIANRIPYIFQVYEGEGHGFRREENLLDYYTQVERFLRQQVLFAPSTGG